MKTFKEEYHELLKWRFEKFEESDKLSSEFNGRDGSEQCLQERKDGIEYRKRLKALKEKYNITD
jgi:hypothetical protein